MADELNVKLFSEFTNAAQSVSDVRWALGHTLSQGRTISKIEKKSFASFCGAVVF